MSRKLVHLVALAVLALSALALAIPPASADIGPQGNLFVKQAGPELRLQGHIYRFAGANNYYLMYKSPAMVDDVLNTAAAGQFRVLRIWGSLDIGNQDGSNSIPGGGKADGVYFQYWNGAAPAYNDGDDGLKHLDYVIAQAGKKGLRLVIPFVNNWSAFGGIDQYVRWANGQYHDQFYADPAIRQWFRNWITHLLNRTNTVTGIQYKNDPTIMTWELANEPRCKGSGLYPPSASCNTQTLISWANEMSTFIKSIDVNHMVSVGDEGFYCMPGATDWTENCGEGVDTLAFAALRNIDVTSYHLYPDSWGKDAAWGTEWIERHIQDAKALRKPSMLGEFGLQDKSIRNPVYKQWTDAVFTQGGQGALYWILSGKQDDGTYYQDYDGFTVYGFNPAFITLGNFSQMMTANKSFVFPPVADDDIATTEYETPVTLRPATNDIAYGGASVVPATIDLDPAISGQQMTADVTGGRFALQADGGVLFTPATSFSGTAKAEYVISDSAARFSDVAALTVKVKPNPTAPIMLYSFETGEEGWGPGSWQSGAGSVAQSTDWASDGTHSLKVDSSGGGWFGVDFNTPIDLTAKTTFSFDLKTVAAGTSREVALKFGDNWTWCEGGGWGWIAQGTTTTVDIDMLSLSCGQPDFSKLHGIYIWMSGGGTFYIDAVRAH